MKKNNVTLITLGSAIALMCGSMQVAHAHAGFQFSKFNDKGAQISSGGVVNPSDTSTTSYNALRITHGCNFDTGEAANVKDVIALSVLFPYAATKTDAANNIVYKTFDSVAHASGAGSLGNKVDTGVYKNMTTEITTIVPDYATATDQTAVGTLGHDLNFDSSSSTGNLGPIVTPLLTGNMFPNAIPTIVNGKMVGWKTWAGNPYGGSPLVETAKDSTGYVSTTGMSPFALGSIKFPANSCAKQLVIRPAAINWCDKGAASYKKGNRADVWQQSTNSTNHFAKLMAGSGSGAVTDPSAVQEGSAPATITVVNTGYTTAPAGCTYDTVILEPSDTFVNTNLPISTKAWPLGAGSGNVFWPGS